MGELDVRKALDAGIEYRDGVAQINLDGSPITDKRYVRLPGDHFGLIHHGGKIKEIDHQPTAADLRICHLKWNEEQAKKAAETKRARKTAQESLTFLLSCAAEPAEAKQLIRTLTGGEMSDTMKNFFDVPAEENNLTQYDLVNLAMITAAKNGDTKAANYVRDTIGDKLAEKTEINATFTEGDRSLLEKVSNRLAILSSEYLPEITEDE